VNFSDPFGLCPKWMSRGYDSDCDYNHDGRNSGSEIATYNADHAKNRLVRWHWKAIALFNKALEDPRGAAIIPLLAGSIRGPDFIVNTHGEALVIPDGAVGPAGTESPGFQYTGGTGGGPGLDSRVTGVRIMDPVSNSPRPQGRRVNYMNDQGQTVDPQTGRTVAPNDPRGHTPYRVP